MAHDDSSGEDGDAGQKLYREDQSALLRTLAELMEERDLDEERLVPLLIEAAYYYRAIGYLVATVKPSETGLRMDLDRMRKLIDEVHRDYRKNAGAVLKDLTIMFDTVTAAHDDDAAVDDEDAGPPRVISDGSGR